MKQFLPLADAAEREHGLPPGLVRAVMKTESDGNPRAVSPAGAQGLMQFMPATAKQYGIDPMDPAQAIAGGARMLADLQRKYGGDLDKTLAAYNFGQGNVDRGRALPRETREYIPKVKANMGAMSAGPKLVPVEGDPFAEPGGAEPRLVAVDGDPFAEKPAEPAAPKRTTGQELLRQVGLTGRAVAKAVAMPGAMVGDALGLDTSKTVDGLLDRVLPKPEGATERIVQDVAGAMTGAGGTVAAGRALAGAAGPVAQGVGRALAAAPGAQLASAVTGAGAAGVAREEGAGPVGQVAAGIAGAVAPSLASAVPGAVRSALVGGEAGRQRVAENLRAFGEAGVTPTAGQASESRLLRAVDSILSKTPGGAGPMAKKAQAQAAGIGDRVEEIAAAAAPRTSAEISGRAIKAGIEGDGGFVQRFRERQAELYGRLDRHLPQTTPIEVGRTKAALASLNEGIPDAPALSEWFKNAKIKGIEGALKDDMAGTPPVTSAIVGANGQPLVTAPGTPARATMPYESIKRLRTLVGKELENPSLVADVPKSKWKALYAALSDDLGQAAVKASPEARAAWERANAFTRAGMDRISRLESIVGAADPEKIFAAATSGTKEGASRLRAVMQSLRPEEQKQVAATLTRRLGAATAGQQNDVGDVFSSETFLTNLNRLSPEARRLIFGKLGDGSRESIERLAKMAANVREGSRVFANPSGTAGQLTAQHMGLGAAGALIAGQPGLAAAAAGTAIGANGLAKLMQNPAFVRGLARPGEGAPALSPALLNVLSQTEPGLERAE